MSVVHAAVKTRPKSIAQRRAELVVQCACDVLGLAAAPAVEVLHLPLCVQEFEQELRRRFGQAHPELVFRTDSTTERARLERRPGWNLPKVMLRQGAPVRNGRAHAEAGNGAGSIAS